MGKGKMTEARHVLGSQRPGYIGEGREDFRTEIVNLAGLKLQGHHHIMKVQLITGRQLITWYT